MAGWIKQWEIPEDHWLRSDLRYIGAWYELLKMAETKARKIVRNGRMIETERGTVYTSILELSNKWSVSRTWTRHFLELLEADGMIERQQKDTKTTTLKVNNYAKYQDAPKDGKTAERQQKDNKRAAEEQQKDNKRAAEGTFFLNSVEGKEGIEGEKERRRFTPPTLHEIQAYVFMNNLKMDAQRFLDYYKANGWKVGKNPMKDWKAACRSWAAREKDDQKPNAKKFDNFTARPSEAFDELVRQLEEERRPRYA